MLSYALLYYGRRHRGCQWFPALPLKICAPHFISLAPRLLHTSDVVLKIFGPLLWFFSPLLRNPGDGLVLHSSTKDSGNNASARMQGTRLYYNCGCAKTERSQKQLL